MNFTNKLLIFCAISLQIITSNGANEGQCTSMNNDCSEELKAPNKYTKDYNVVLQQINKAQKEYQNCAADPDDQCKCHEEIIKNDLAPFVKTGISRQMIKDSEKFGSSYKILNHKLFRTTNCMFPTRCEGIEHFILNLLPNLTDMDFVINQRDYPQINSHFTTKPKPVFSFSKTDEYYDIMYPAWTFWAGGPAISLYPTGIGRWDLHREKIVKTSESLPWDTKLSKGFFRGSRTSDERDHLVLLSRRKPKLIDAQYTKNQAWKSPKDTLNAEPAKEVYFEEHCKYKYLFNFRGVAASFRFKHLFLCKSLVFHVGDEWLEFFYPAMKPWIHYVPIKKYPTQVDIEQILDFFVEHDDLAREIGTNGYNFIRKHLRMEDVECYWKKLLMSYGKLIKYKVEEDKSMIEIKKKNK